MHQAGGQREQGTRRWFATCDARPIRPLFRQAGIDLDG
jgi:hypothetical protein